MNHILETSKESLDCFSRGNCMLKILKNDRGYKEGDTVLLQVLSEREEKEFYISEVCTENVKTNFIAIVLKEKEN